MGEKQAVCIEEAEDGRMKRNVWIFDSLPCPRLTSAVAAFTRVDKRDHSNSRAKRGLASTEFKRHATNKKAITSQKGKSYDYQYGSHYCMKGGVSVYGLPHPCLHHPSSARPKESFIKIAVPEIRCKSVYLRIKGLLRRVV